MTKKHFIALANAIKAHNTFAQQDSQPIFGPAHLDTLADFCAKQNPQFNRARWLGYINGECSSNGGQR